MKNWIKVIFALNSKLDALTESIDSRVDGLSRVTGGDTRELFDNIIRLNDKKVRLINMRVLHDKMRETLCDREFSIVSESAKGKPLSVIAKEMGLSRTHVYRLYDKVMHRLAKLLLSYGYDEDKFSCDYGDVTLIVRTYKKLAGVKQAG